MQLHITDSEGNQYWTTTQVADYLGVKVDTFKGYVKRNIAPGSATRLDARTPLWDAATVRDWHASRPGRGN